MSSWFSAGERRRSSPQVTRLLERLRALVAEDREANRREIERLKWRLANVLKRELGEGVR
jgi:hypothetical protein